MMAHLSYQQGWKSTQTIETSTRAKNETEAVFPLALSGIGLQIAILSRQGQLLSLLLTVKCLQWWGDRSTRR